LQAIVLAKYQLCEGTPNLAEPYETKAELSMLHPELRR
jgi:hypothetical protein